MSRDLCDETFPTSLLIEFDELDDDIPISPDLPKRHHPGGGYSRLHRTNSSTGAGSASEKNHDDRNVSRAGVSGSSNTSSGHSSLSTEGENRSGSSERHTSRGDMVGRPLSKVHGTENLQAEKPTLKMRKFRPPRSMESLLPRPGAHRPMVSPSRERDAASTRSSTGNVSVASGGHNNQQQQLRHRTKYGHVQSKVKQLIDEMKPTIKRDRAMTLVRHKSMPETSYSAEEEDDTLERETDVDALRANVRELKLQTISLEQQLVLRDLCHTNMFNELTALKCKISMLRTENDHLLEQERAREQHRQLLRQGDHISAGSCYGSQSSLHKAPVSIAATVATQTSPPETVDDPFDFLVLDHPADAPQTPSSTMGPDTAVGRFTPDYEQLLPSTLAPGEDSTRTTPDCRHRTGHLPGSEQSEVRDPPDDPNSPRQPCRDCRRRKGKRKSRKQKLASLFCIRHQDESF